MHFANNFSSEDTMLRFIIFSKHHLSVVIQSSTGDKNEPTLGVTNSPLHEPAMWNNWTRLNLSNIHHSEVCCPLGAQTTDSHNTSPELTDWSNMYLE